MTVRTTAQDRTPEPAAKQKLRLWLRLLRASTRSIEVELRERLRVEAFGVTLPKFDVMAALDRKRGRHDHDRAVPLPRWCRTATSRASSTGWCRKAWWCGWRTRDQRATFVRLTPKGARQFQVMAKAHEAWVNEILAGFMWPATPRP